MYVKIYNRILDSSLAENRPLRHFFMDLLLCADLDGTVIMTKKKLGDRIGATPEEVEWGLAELQKEDDGSLSPDHSGRRIIPLEGHGYGWKIVNFEEYRDMKSAAEMRKKTSERVKRYRERKAAEKSQKESANPHDGLTQLDKVQIKAEQNGDKATVQRCEEIRAELPPGALDQVEKDEETPF